MPQPLPISASVEIDASPDRVWDVVSDLARMPEWSPELRRLKVLGSRVTRLEPGRAVAWRTRESGATWTYELEGTATGTRLTGRRDLPAFSLGTTVLGQVIGGAAGHDQELADGIRTTLSRIKRSVESV